MVNTAKALKKSAQILVLGCISLCLAKTSAAQDSLKVVLLPANSPIFTIAEKWTVSEIIQSQIADDRDFSIVDLEDVEALFNDRDINPDSAFSYFNEIADAFSANLLFLPAVEVSTDSLAFKLSLYDNAIRAIKKTIVLGCACDLETPDSFPVKKAFELLFDAPEIVLSDASDVPPPLPAPLIMPLPIAPPPDDSTAVDEKIDFVKQKNGSGGKWKKIAAGTLIVGGGIAFLTTRNEASGEKLVDPPAPPER